MIEFSESQENPVKVTGYIHPVTGAFLESVADRRGWTRRFAMETALKEGIFSLAAELAVETRESPKVLARARAALAAGDFDIFEDMEEPQISDLIGFE